MSLWCCAMERGKRPKSAYLACIQGDVQPLALRLRAAAATLVRPLRHETGTRYGRLSVVANCLRGLCIPKLLEVPERTKDGLLFLRWTGLCPLRALAIRGGTNRQARQFLAVSNPTSLGLPTVSFFNPTLNLSVCRHQSAAVFRRTLGQTSPPLQMAGRSATTCPPPRGSSSIA